jgi:glycosyltransferase involved in cell wall biosynthesis
MLESVYAQRLPELGYDVSWVMHRASPGRAGTRTWHRSVVHVGRRTAGSLGGIALRAGLAWRAWSVARQGRFDLVQVRNSTALTLVALAARRRTGTRVIHQASFPVLEWTLDRRRSALPPPLRRLALSAGRWLRTAVLARADLVLVVSERMRADLVSQGVPAGRIRVFPLGASDVVDVPDTDVATLRSRLDLGEERVVLYFGAIAPERRLSFLVDVAADVAAHRPDVRWVLVGPVAGDEDARLRERAAAAGVADRVTILGRVPRAEIAAYLALSELSVSPIPPTPQYLVSSPMKVVESLAAGRPVVATPIPDQADLIERGGGGTVAPFEPGPFADAVRALLDDDARRANAGRSGRNYVARHRSYRVLSAEIDRAYRDLLGERR